MGVTQAGFTPALDPEARELGLKVAGVDSRFFRLLGLAPALGADFTKDDESSPALLSPQSGVPLPVIIDHGLWQRAFGGDPGVLGVRELAGHRVRIVGVMGPGVKFPGETDVWAPLRLLKPRPPAYARLAPGATVEQLAARFPALEFKELADAIRPDGGRTLLVLFGAACLLLLVAWVQVAALVFAGAIGRFHELGVRLSLGAGRLRLARQFAIENALLAGIAFALAWIAARPLTAFVVSVLPRELSRGQYLTPDIRTFMFASAASLIGLALLIALPIAVIRHTSPLRLLEGHVGQLPFTAERLRHGLLVAQVALTALLLYLSGLMVHSFVRAATFDYGFDSKHVLLFTPPLPAAPAGANLTKYRNNHPEFDARYEEKLRRTAASLESLHGIPGVIASASLSSVPLVKGGSRPWTSEPGRPYDHWEEVSEFGERALFPSMRARGDVVSPEFVRALGAELVAGRGFDDPDYAGMVDIVIVNKTLARQLAPTASVMGSELYVGLLGSTIRTTWEGGRIVGVVNDLVYSTPAEPAAPQFFVPPRRGAPFGVVVIRTSASVGSALPAIRTALERVWGDLPPKHFTLLRDAWHTGLVPFRGKALLLTLIAGFCVPLAAIGLLGALLYSVEVRARETAIRIALGAEPLAVRRAV
ncbi:MAG TPA: ABC transporter permease, partial [Gemmatimonadaceae bacterium]